MTPADLARARELHAAMVDGSARPEDVAELVRLLPAVFEVAEHVVTHSECPSCSDMGVCVALADDDA